MERSLGFWSEMVGLEVQFSGDEFSFLDGDGVQLILNQVDKVPEDESMTEIVFQLDDVIEAYDVLADRGVGFEVELRPVTSDGDKDLLAAHFHDPDGHIASITGWIGRA